jgi:DtxR family manganese transport transcriptional regulator
MESKNSKRARAVERERTRMLPAEAQAAIQRRTRSANDAETAQDYLEVIADLIDAVGEARAVDIARRLGVTHVTVVKTVGRLQRNGLVTSRPYRSIFLTDSGRQVAEDARRRHEIVREFLVALGVAPTTAEADAEGMEHHVSEETLNVFTKFTRAKNARAR